MNQELKENTINASIIIVIANAQLD